MPSTQGWCDDVGAMMDASHLGETCVVTIFEETSGWFLEKKI